MRDNDTGLLETQNAKETFLKPLKSTLVAMPISPKQLRARCGHGMHGPANP
jgi:hypothetical protein